MAKAMAGQQLIVDFPTHRKRSVDFADTSLFYIVPRHDVHDDVHREDLWYNNSDYSRMKLARQDFIHNVRAMASAGVPIRSSSARDEGSSFDGCLIGIEHLLTPATVLEVMVCRRRCVRVVLEEQARQMMNPLATTDALGWDNIAIASIVETRRATVKARKLGKLHHDQSKNKD
eukprot:scaffold12351_cov141-Skeletonema_menzelii.AAC.1